ncbi:hypothetical protein PR048_014893 [Dryococelus australis]|uniref:Reverse transcriptase n=1 Tax=Dryococelus australis TaxID=614101 RepID=A0ABQ9HFL0_9NEOP|nr:hypothetical protein PR048_014893 [Dryococelus australis]
MELKKLYQSCKFWEMRDGVVKDRIISGLRDRIFLCTRCGKKHPPQRCPGYAKVCKVCNKIRHFASVCNSKMNSAHQVNKQMGTVINISEESSNGDLVKKVLIKNRYVKLKLDMGPQVNIITADEIELGIDKVPSTAKLENYSGIPIPVVHNLFEGIGVFNYTYIIKVRDGAEPQVAKPMKIPFYLLYSLQDELCKLEPTQWVNSLVVVRKSDNSLRICLNPFKLYKEIAREYFLLPTFEELVSKMPQAKVFTTLDGFKGFWQIIIDEESQEVTTFNTPFGRYQFTRLPWLSSALEVS